MSRIITGAIYCEALRFSCELVRCPRLPVSFSLPADSTDREPTETNEGSQSSDQSEKGQLEFDSLWRC